MAFPIELILFAFLVVIALTITQLRDLFGAAMLTGIFSLLAAGLFTLMDAVDVAFTEAAVGAGISTVLILVTLSLTEEREGHPRRQIVPIAIVAVTGAALVYATLDMPSYGDPAAPIHRHVAPHYLLQSPDEIGLPNVVTAVLASYRGFDTLGELMVILTAGIAVMLVLGIHSRSTDRRRGQTETTPRMRMRMREKMVLRVVSKRFIPFVLLFGLYVQAHGDFGPGGGFQAGVIFAAGLILYAMIFGIEELKRVVPPRVAEFGAAVGALLFGGIGVLTVLLGGNYLDYGLLDVHEPAHGQHLGILGVELGVGITVAAVMVTLYFGFASRSSGEPS